MLARLTSDRNPDRLLVATDEDWRPAFRVQAIPSYKTHRLERGAMPAELEPQQPVILEFLQAAGVAVLGAKGYEAEDVIASALPGVTGRVEIVTGDRDLFSLVEDPDVCVLYTQQGIGRLLVVDEAEVERRYGIPGRAYGDFAILRGDPSDGLPGVPGIGEKTAAQLVRRYGSLDGVIKSGRLGTAAVAYVEQARRVAVPVGTIPLTVPPSLRPRRPADSAALARLNEEYGIASVTERFVRSMAGVVTVPPIPIERS
jgi:5'-3' exonuclease